ncbi:MAG: Zn-ribbon domain-containing OB-fold protein [Myxococcota bacterium]|nr:Zn-ribbon domain-containing OB-fold protein [Myxococcota bacterium]
MAEFQHPKPAASWETRAYWEGCGRHELVLQRCRQCKAVQHRPRAVCAGCLGNDIEHFVASGRGSVYTYTVTHQNGVPPFRDALPYVLAYVDLEEGPRLMTNIVGCEPEQVAIGMPVVVDFQDVEAGERGATDVVLAVPRFRPA